jgi:uncharacterized membrane protein YccC
MSSLDAAELSKVNTALEEHLTKEEAHFLRHDRGFMGTLITARFHTMASEARREFLAAKAEEIHERIAVMRATNALQNLPILLQGDVHRFTADQEQALQQSVEARAKREAAERELATKEQQDRIHKLKLELEEAELRQKLEALGSVVKAPKPKPPTLTEQIDALLAECAADLQGLRDKGVKETDAVYQQRKNKWDIKIDALRRRL